MNRKQLHESVRQALGGTATAMAAELAIDAVVRAISDGLKKDGIVRLAHFGTFERSRKQPRRLTLPHNGEPLTLQERTVIRFRPSPSVIRKKPSKTDNMPSN